MARELLALPCKACGEWTITAVSIWRDGIAMRCTYCGDAALVRCARRHITASVKGLRIFSGLSGAKHPALQALRKAGDHIVFSVQDAEAADRPAKPE